jgi:hypothetical protein
MGSEHFLDETRWPLLSRRRKFRIGDMMAAVVMIAIGLAAVSRPELPRGGTVSVGAFVVLCLGLQWAQWGLASIPTNRPAIGVLLGALSAIIAVLVIFGLVFLGLAFPQVAALLIVMMLILVVHLATWD